MKNETDKELVGIFDECFNGYLICKDTYLEARNKVITKLNQWAMQKALRCIPVVVPLPEYPNPKCKLCWESINRLFKSMKEGITKKFGGGE